MNINEGFKQLKEMNASVLKIVMRNDDDVAIRAIIWVDGIEETGDILGAIQETEDSWD